MQPETARRGSAQEAHEVGLVCVRIRGSVTQLEASLVPVSATGQVNLWRQAGSMPERVSASGPT